MAMKHDDEANYLKALKALEAGTLPDDDMPWLTGQLTTRLRAAGVPREFRDRCWDIFGEYKIYVHERPNATQHMTAIADAATKLADALASSGKSPYYKIIDDELFRRIITETDSSEVMHRAIRERRWIGDASPNIGMERYLRAFAALLAEQVECTNDYYEWMGPVGTEQGNNSKALKPFIGRRTREIVDLVGEKDWAKAMPKQWRPKRFGLDGTLTPQGNNKIATRLTEIILATSLSENYIARVVDKTKRGKRGDA